LVEEVVERADGFLAGGHEEMFLGLVLSALFDKESEAII
jgi:hypothetical protein